MKGLSKKLSEAIRQSLDDLRACEDDPKYAIFMGTWHSPMTDGFSKIDDTVCEVCLAGAVMAKRLGFKPYEFIEPDFCDVGENAPMLRALDLIRLGEIPAALSRIGIKPTGELANPVSVPSYDNDRERFYTNLECIAATLEEYGL